MSDNKNAPDDWKSPNWDYYDHYKWTWHDYVDDYVKRKWNSIDDEIKIALAINFQILADKENSN